jgi:hypothetical protein
MVNSSKDWIVQQYIKDIVNNDFYYENGKKVMTEQYHIKRGYCCGSNCRHCPYEPKGEKFSIKLKSPQ